jgi:hypothetical protein
MRVALALACALACQGCIAIPALLPPARGSIGIGGAFGNPVPDEDGTPLRRDEAMVVGRIGLVPATLWREQFLRPVEIEAGYSFQIFLSDLWQQRNRHGGFLGVNVLLGQFFVDAEWRARVVVHGAAEIMAYQGRPGDGGGGSWSLGFEAANFVNEGGEGGSGPQFIGAIAGEFSIGAELFGGVYSISGEEYGIFAFAITVRWPGMAGIGVIPLAGSF